MTTPAQEELRFPCETLPDDPAAARLLGVYPQRQPGLFMQRVKTLGGRISGEQWRTLASLAREFTPSAPLHLTTRQEVELHELDASQVPRVQRRMSEAKLTGLGAAGDTLRNVTVCPCSGATNGRADLAPLAWEVRLALEGEEEIFALPRKFKVSFSACAEACGRPFVNDLAFVARGPSPYPLPQGERDETAPSPGPEGERDGTTFRVIAAGSLGAKPGTGIELFDELSARDVLPLSVAALRFFRMHGDRENRTRARLRHVRERMGDEAFVAALREAFDETKRSQAWPDVTVPRVRDGFGSRMTLTFPNGDVTPTVAEALGALADNAQLAVRIGLGHRVIVSGPDECVVNAAVQSHEELAPAMGLQPWVAACPGTRWCSRGLVDTNALADRIRREFEEDLGPNTAVCISGCPNGCAHSRIAEVGLVGVKRNGAETFNLYTRGGLGRDNRLAEEVAVTLSPDDVVRHLRRIVGRQDRTEG